MLKVRFSTTFLLRIIFEILNYWSADLLNTDKPDERQIMTYVSCYYHAFQGAMQVNNGFAKMCFSELLLPPNISQCWKKKSYIQFFQKATKTKPSPTMMGVDLQQRQHTFQQHKSWFMPKLKLEFRRSLHHATDHKLKIAKTDNPLF